MREEANQAVDDKCRVCLRAPAYNDSIYPNIAGFQCDACLDAEIKAADPDYKDAIESETEMPVSVALEFSLKATALQQSTMAEHNAKHCKIPEKSRKVEELYVPNDEAHPGTTEMATPPPEIMQHMRELRKLNPHAAIEAVRCPLVPGGWAVSFGRGRIEIEEEASESSGLGNDDGNAAVMHERRAAKADRHKPPGPNMGIQGFAFPTVTPTYNGARYRWLMQGWDSEFLANP
jgi:hypothetical protein